jgi:hypothetical protein
VPHVRPLLARRLLFVLVVGALGAAPAFAQRAAAPTVVFPPLDGWTFVSEPAVPLADVCLTGADGVVAAKGTPTGYMATKTTHADYRLHAEWRWSATPGNGGVLLHIASGPKNGAWPVCIQVQLKHGAVGDLLPMVGATFVEPLTTAPDAKTPALAHRAPDSEKPAGEWNAVDIVCAGGTIEVTVNGVVQNRVTGLSVASGAVGFQFEGAPFDLRNVTLTPLTKTAK